MRLPLSALAFTLCFAAASAQSPPANSRLITVVIETEILPSDPVAGLKSRQTVTVDLAAKAASQQWVTGTTYGIPSTRNNFELLSPNFAGTGASFRVVGETASGVQVMPNINYDFTIEVGADGSAKLKSGCHDGYPAYKIMIDGRELYNFVHESIRLDRLYGECEVKTILRSLPPR